MTAGAMAGHGRPLRSRDALVRRASAWLASALLLAATLVVPLRAAPAQEATPDIGLRIAFGGGAARLWRGSITLSDGTFSHAQALGLEPDEPGSIQIAPQTIQLRQPSPRSYDGLDVDVRAPLDATLRVRLVAADDPAGAREFSFRLEELKSGLHPRGEEQAGELDAVGNRLVICRRPGDELRVEMERDSLVFTPGETFGFRIVPNKIALEPATMLRMRMAIVSRATGEEHLVREQDVKVADDGSLSPWGPHEFVVPAGDGVYELEITLSKRSFLDPLAGVNPLATTRPLVERRLQFIAIASEPPTRDDSPREELVDEFDPVDNDWAERVARLPLLKHVPRMKQGRLSHGKVTVHNHLGRRWSQLAADAWQAHPLSITLPGTPHVLEVEYPNNVPQRLGISVLETNAVGAVAPLGVDSAVEVEPLAAGEKPGVARQRLIFWPRTKTPVLLLTSLQDDAAAIYGRVRLYRFTGPLAPRLARPAPNERLVAAWLDKPLFPEMFSAAEARDLATTRSLDDWQTFYEGATRLAEYLPHAGYNAVVVPALCEGSTLYPSQLLQPTPKYDTGTFLTAGQDPQRKDVLEVLFRVCGRQGLALIPSLQFDTPLPELETLARSDVRQQVGLELIDYQGRTWFDTNIAKGGIAPYYNPLDSRVQQAMARVAGEVAQRYGHHASFGGVVLQLSPRGYALLPHAGWGFDDKTYAAFAAAQGVANADAGAGRFAARARYCATTGRDAWLAWRASQMTALYAGIAAEVDRAKPGAPLILAGHDMCDSEALRQTMRPTLQARPNTELAVRSALLEIGIDAAAIGKLPHVALVAPQPILPTNAGGLASDWDAAAAAQLHAQLPQRGTLFYREPVTRRLATFDAASPFGPQNTYTWLAAQVAPAGAANRRRWVECLVREQQDMVFDGGWMIARGQEGELSDLLATLRSLPRGKPTLLAQPGGESEPPIRVLTYAGERKTTACVINPTPWPIGVRLQVAAGPRVSVSALGPELKAPPLASDGRGVVWAFDLPAYGAVSGVFDQANVAFELEEARLPADLREQLVEKLNEVRQRAAALKNPQPLAAVANAGFEEPPPEAERDDDDDDAIPGWLFAQGEKISVKRKAGGYRESAHALHIASEGPEVWVRSQPLPAPRTGRVAVWVRLRSAQPDRQPELRLAIEARRGRQSYYRYATVGAGSAAPLGERWAPFVLQIDDLPRQGLEEFRIGFDLMGAGDVWVDDVEVFDASFTEKEQFEILRRVTAASYYLQDGNLNLAAAASVLDGYWPRFLLAHVESPTVEAAAPVALPSPPASGPPAREPPRDERQSKRGWFRWMPSMF